MTAHAAWNMASSFDIPLFFQRVAQLFQNVLLRLRKDLLKGMQMPGKHIAGVAVIAAQQKGGEAVFQGIVVQGLQRVGHGHQLQ
nr:hypothetical protein [uncultured Dysosmobacter sp.]